MGDVQSPAPGVSPVTIDTGAVCFKMRGVALNTAGTAFIEMRARQPEKPYQNDYHKDTKAQFAPRKNMAMMVSINMPRNVITVTILTQC